MFGMCRKRNIRATHQIEAEIQLELVYIGFIDMIFLSYLQWLRHLYHLWNLQICRNRLSMVQYTLAELFGLKETFWKTAFIGYNITTLAEEMFAQLQFPPQLHKPVQSRLALKYLQRPLQPFLQPQPVNQLIASALCLRKSRPLGFPRGPIFFPSPGRGRWNNRLS